MNKSPDVPSRRYQSLRYQALRATPVPSAWKEIAPAPVVVSHPGRQHSYETALSAQDAGLLYRYLTAFYRTSRPLLPRIWFALPPRVKSRLDAELRRRWHPELDPGLISTHPLTHLGARFARRMPSNSTTAIDLDGAANRAFDRVIGRWLTASPRLELVHAFEGAALRTLRTARQMGYVTVLDVPSRHEDYVRLNTEEAKRWDLQHSPPSVAHTLRVQQERAAADVLLAPAEGTVQTLLEHGVPRDRILLLPYGATPALSRPSAGRHSGFRVLFAGQIGLRKGIGYLLETWSRLDLRASELLLVGDADAHGQAILARYAGLYRRLPAVPHADMPMVFATSDLFVFPSLVEGSPLVVYEAMAAGLPVVTTENAIAAVRHGIDGLVVPIRDTSALEEAITFMHRNPEARRRMGENGRRRIQEGFTWMHYRARLAAIYKSLLTTGRADSPLLPTTGL